MAVAMESFDDQSRFESAVKIITGLPKDGSFQPSNELKLKFYAFYKQATLGPCVESKPGFWDVVRRAKWEAWKSLGEMSKEDAMKGYVNTLKQVVETMTLSSDVQDFLNQLGPMYEFVTVDGKTVTSHERLSDEDEETLNGGTVQFVNGDVKLTNGLPKNGQVVDEPNGFARNYVKASSKLSLSESPSDDETFADAPDIEIKLNSSGLSATASKFIPARRINPRPVTSTGANLAANSLIDGNVRSKGVQSDDDFDKLPKDRRRAANELGRTLRDLPELGSAADRGGVSLKSRSPEECDDALVRAWEAVSQMRVQNLSWSNEGEEKLVRRHVRTRTSTRKHRGRGSGSSSNDKEKSRQQGDSDVHSSGSEAHHSNDRPGGEEPPGHNRSERHSSGTSSESSKDSAGFDWDPHVGTVLLRMHRDLQHICRQLELMEGILITQQQMVRNALVQVNQNNKNWFSNMRWRTILFIVIWPVVVNFVLRYCWFRFIRRRRL